MVECGGPHVISEQEQARLLTPSLAPSPIRCGLWRLSWGVRSLYRIENIFGEDGKAVKSLWMNASLTIIPEMFLYHLGPFPNVKCQTDNKNSGTSWAQSFFLTQELVICAVASRGLIKNIENQTKSVNDIYMQRTVDTIGQMMPISTIVCLKPKQICLSVK